MDLPLPSAGCVYQHEPVVKQLLMIDHPPMERPTGNACGLPARSKNCRLSGSARACLFGRGNERLRGRLAIEVLRATADL
ncbi:MAG: hypothetical protein NZ899_07305 [Thermoguttaceae bacterium]|nr:hypothetical protein [Thermoguttaceae bacterium]MDW8079640.1 hypothetical protein [Thermoguttaceae bacterium]